MSTRHIAKAIAYLHTSLYSHHHSSTSYHTIKSIKGSRNKAQVMRADFPISQSAFYDSIFCAGIDVISSHVRDLHQEQTRFSSVTGEWKNCRRKQTNLRVCVSISARWDQMSHVMRERRARWRRPDLTPKPTDWLFMFPSIPRPEPPHWSLCLGIHT